MDEPRFTGVFTFPDPADPDRRQFGMAAGSLESAAARTVTIILRTQGTNIKYEIVEGGVRLDVPAVLLHKMLPIIARCLDELEAL